MKLQASAILKFACCCRCYA